MQSIFVEFRIYLNSMEVDVHLKYLKRLKSGWWSFGNVDVQELFRLLSIPNEILIHLALSEVRFFLFHIGAEID